MRTARLTIVLPAARRSLLRLPPRRQHGLGVFTNHESRPLCFSRDTAFIAMGARGVAQPETAVRTTAPAGKSLFSSSSLFAIVHYCSPLFAIVREKILSGATVPSPPTTKTRPVRFSRITAFIAARSLLSCALWRNCCAAMAWLWSGCGACGAAMAMARHGRPWRGMGGILPPRQRPCPVSLSRSPSGQPPLPRTPNEPMLKKENILHGAISGAFYIASKPNLHFSPRGEAKCVRGPSDISSGANQAPSHGFHESRDTNHESRPFFACFDRRVVRNAG